MNERNQNLSLRTKWEFIHFWNTSRHNLARNLTFVFLGKEKMNYIIRILKDMFSKVIV